MKSLLLILIVCAVAGCSKQSTTASGGAAPSALTQKLQGMTPEQRTEYVKTHMGEVMSSANVPGVPQKKS